MFEGNIKGLRLLGVAQRGVLFPIREVLPLIAFLGIVDAVMTFWDARGVIGIAVITPVGTPDLNRATHQFVNAPKPPTRKQLFYLHMVSIAVLTYLHVLTSPVDLVKLFWVIFINYICNYVIEINPSV